MTISKVSNLKGSSPPGLWFPFYGGLGDILLRCYQTRFWHCLEAAGGRVGVVVASVNPYATELFRWHINRRNIVLFDLGHALTEFESQGVKGADLHEALARFAGLSWPGKYNDFLGPPPVDWQPKFFAPDYLDERGHVVFHPFAGLEHRTLTAAQVKSVLAVLGKLPCKVYVPSRDFIRLRSGSAAHGAEDFPDDLELPDNVVVLKNLSVPATINLIRNAVAFVGAHSSLVLAAACEGVRSLALYPAFLAEEFAARRGYAFYAAFEHMTALSFPEVDATAVETWIQAVFEPEDFGDHAVEGQRVRATAEWVIEQGGSVNIDWCSAPDFLSPDERNTRRCQPVRCREELPGGRFKLWRINFANCAEFGDDDLVALTLIAQGVNTVTNLNLSGTAVTAAGIARLAELGMALRKLNPGQVASTGGGLEKIARLFPGCEIVTV